MRNKKPEPTHPYAMLYKMTASIDVGELEEIALEMNSPQPCLLGQTAIVAMFAFLKCAQFYRRNSKLRTLLDSPQQSFKLIQNILYTVRRYLPRYVFIIY